MGEKTNPIARLSATIKMKTTKEYDIQLSETSKIDWIHGQTRRIERDLQVFEQWDVTIDVGVRDKGIYIDALIISIHESSYVSWIDTLEDGKSYNPEYKIVQLPKGWSKEMVHNFVLEHRYKIEETISDFTSEAESQD